MRIDSFCFLLVSSAVLASCAAGDVDLESRSISVQQTAEPAGAPLSQGLASLVSHVGPSYVTLTVSKVEDKTKSGEKSGKTAVTSGSGFIVENDGYVMTAAHVAVEAGNSVSARAANGRVYSGTVVSILPQNDIAIIRLRGFQGHAVVPVASACMNTGATLFSLGKPHAQGDTARFGTVISMNFGKAVQYGKFGYPDAMVMKMNTQKGESGGPVFDDQRQARGHGGQHAFRRQWRLAQHGPRGTIRDTCQIPVFQHQVLGKLGVTGALRRPNLRKHLNQSIRPIAPQNSTRAF